MTDPELFDRAVMEGGYGVRAVLSDDYPGKRGYEHLRRLAQNLIDSVRSFVGDELRIHLDFYRNTQLNALAFRAEDRYFIGVPTGAVFLLELLLMRMLSDRELFPHIGDTTRERESLSRLKYEEPDAREFWQRGYIASLPKDPVRHAFAVNVLEQAFLFLVGHEIAHITLGHVDYLLNTSDRFFLAEADSTDLTAEKLLERQCLEMHADRRSVQSRMAGIVESEAEEDLPPPVWAKHRLNRYNMMFLCSFGMNTIFRVFGDPVFDPEGLMKRLYPPFPLRRMMATSAAAGLAVQIWGPESLGFAKESLATAINYTEICFGRIIDSATSFNVHAAFSEAGLKHHRLLVEKSQKLKAELAPFSREPQQAGRAIWYKDDGSEDFSIDPV